jgi:hypothetical protein
MRNSSTILCIAFVLTACGGTLERYDEDTSLSVDAIPEPVADITADTGGVDAIPDPSTEPHPDPVADIGTDIGPATGTVGAPCSDDSACGGVPGPDALCMTSIGAWISFPGGYCTAYCTDDGPCGTAGRCVIMYSYGICMQPCTDPSQCRMGEGYTCYSIPYVTDDTYCVPPM